MGIRFTQVATSRCACRLPKGPTCWGYLSEPYTHHPEFPFWPRQCHHGTPVSPVRDTVKRVFYRSTLDGLPAAAAQPKIAPFVAYFCNTSPYPNQLIDGFRCRLDHDPPIPSVSVAARCGLASPRTAAASDAPPPARTSSSAHASQRVIAGRFKMPVVGTLLLSP